MLCKVGIGIQNIGNSHNKCFHCSLLYGENAMFCMNYLCSLYRGRDDKKTVL